LENNIVLFADIGHLMSAAPSVKLEGRVADLEEKVFGKVRA